MRRADAVVTICEGLRTEIIERGVDPARVSVVPREPSGKFRYYRPARANGPAQPTIAPDFGRKREDRLKMV